MDDDALIEHGLSGRRRAMEWSLEQWGDVMDIDDEGNGREEILHILFHSMGGHKIPAPQNEVRKWCVDKVRDLNSKRKLKG